MVVKKLKTLDGQSVEFVDQVIASGGMKDVYFSPDRSYVVAFFRDKQDFQAKDRLNQITGKYRENLFNQVGGPYWKGLFCWPTGVVEHEGRLGIVAPTYSKHFFFKDGKEKEGKWYASPKLRSRHIAKEELGDWLSYLRVCILISRAVKRLHAAGLAHSDLSYKNILIDPAGGHACVIDVDGLVVPGRYPPDVVGTPDFIAPEVVATCHLSKTDPARKLPSITTDRHALAVLIYMYLLYRHPLDGDKVHDKDDETRDQSLRMGERAIFVEHPADQTNRIRLSNIDKKEQVWALPWKDTAKLPYTVTGPYLSALFERAFIDGLHEPMKRPTANEWEDALVRTVDLIQPCANSSCDQKWYVFANTTKPRCPFCGTAYSGTLPILNLYSSRKEGQFRPDNHRLMVYTNQSLFSWHVNRNIAPNEKLADDLKKRVGYFVLHNQIWYLVNESLPDLMDAATKTSYPPGQKVELKDGQQLLLSKQEGGRLAVVQLVKG